MATLETFDGVTAPAIPTGYTAGADLVTATAAKYSGTNGVRVTSAQSSAVGGYLASDATDGYGGNVSVTAKVKLVSGGAYNEARVYARASSTNLVTASGYFAVFTVGVAALYKQVSGTGTPIGVGPPPGGPAADVWYEVGVHTSGSFIGATLRRVSDNNWLNSSGSFQTAFAYYRTTTNTDVSEAAGHWGLTVYRYDSVETYADDLQIKEYSGGIYPDYDALHPQIFADVSSITPTAEPVDVETFAWTKLQQVKPLDLISPVASLFDQDFTSGSTENWTKYDFGSATGGFSGGKYNISLPTTGGGSGLDCVTVAVPDAPWFACRADVAAMPIAPAGATFCRIMVGRAKDDDNHRLAFYDSVTNALGIERRVGGTASTAGSITLDGPLGAPFTLYYVETGFGVSVYVDAGNGPKRMLSLTASVLDFQDATTGADYAAAFVAKADPTGATQTISLTRFEAGYFGTISMSDHWWVRNLDGTPYTTGSGSGLTAYFTADQGGLSAQTEPLYQFATTHCGVYALDVTTLAFAEVGKIFFTRGGYLYGDAATQILWDAGNSRWSVLHGSYGDWPANHYLDVLYATSSSNLLSGVHVLSDTATVTQPLSTSIVDFDAIKVGGQMYLACTPTSDRDTFTPGWSSGIALYSCDDDFTNLVELAYDPDPTFQEGPRFFRLNGTDWYWGTAQGYGGISQSHTVDSGYVTQDMPGSDSGVYFLTAIADFVVGSTRLYVRLAFDDTNESTNGAGPVASHGGFVMYAAKAGIESTGARRRRLILGAA